MSYSNPSIVELKNLKALKSLQSDVSGDENLLIAVFSLNPQDNLVEQPALAGPHDDQLTKPVIETTPYALALSDDTGLHLRLLTAEEVLPTIVEKAATSKKGKSVSPPASNEESGKDASVASEGQ